MIDPTKYGTATEVASLIDKPRMTLTNGVRRGEVEHCETVGGTLLISVADAKRWAGQTRKTGPKKRA